MVQFDLTNTPLAITDTVASSPTVGELTTILVALLLVEGLAYDQLADQTVVLSKPNVDAVAVIIEARLQNLAPELCTGGALRRSLAELVGLTVGPTTFGPAA